MISFIPIEVPLVDVNSVILVHAALNHRNELLHGILILFVFLDLFAKAFDVALLREIDVLWPSSFLVLHTSVLHYDSFGVYFSYTQLWSIVDSSGGGGAS